MLKVAHYTRNTVRTISRYYYTPSKCEAKKGREELSFSFETHEPSMDKKYVFSSGNATVRNYCQKSLLCEEN